MPHQRLSDYAFIAEAAQALGEAPSTTRAKVDRGELPAIRIGSIGARAIPWTAIDKVLALRGGPEADE